MKISALATAFLVLAIGGCGANEDVLFGASSPDNRIDAIFVRSEHGTLAADTYSIHLLTDRSSTVSDSNNVLTLSSLNCIAINWINASTLRVFFSGTIMSTKAPPQLESNKSSAITLQVHHSSDCRESTADSLIFAPRERPVK